MNRKDREINERNQTRVSKSNVIYVESDPELAVKNQERQQALAQRKRRITLLALLLALLGIIFLVSLRYKRYRGYRIVESVATDYENTSQYISYADNLLKYTAAGVSYINSNGDTVWTAGINMNAPIAQACGDYALVADKGGNNVCVFSKSGLVSSVTMPYRICDIDIAKQGAFAVILENERTNYVNLYDRDGNIICELQATIDKSGYPLDVALSNNGEKLIVSYLVMDGATVKNNLTAYNFGDVGQNTNADRIVGGYEFEDEMIPKVCFVDNDTIAAFGTGHIYIYTMKEKPAEKATIKFDDEIHSVFYGADYIGVVCGRDDEKVSYTLKVYDLKGRNKFKQEVDFRYDHIYTNDEEIILSGDKRCMIVRRNGSVKYSGELEDKILNIAPSGRKNEYIVIYTGSTDLIRLKTTSGVSGREEDAPVATDTDMDIATGSDADTQ